MAEDTKETIKIGAKNSKGNLNFTLDRCYERLLFLSGSVHAMDGLDEPDCKVLEGYLMDIARDIEKGSKILEDFDFVSK